VPRPHTSGDGARAVDRVVRVGQRDVPTRTVIAWVLLLIPTTRIVVPVLGTSTLYQPGW